jgi:epoxyqueuosine reductase
VKEEIRQKAIALGFDGCRFTHANPPEHSDDFLRWLEGGQHGEMAYLQRNSKKRVAPDLVLPGARSIITLATSYAEEATPNIPTEDRSKAGLIAKYARYSDYHDVLAERLKQLVAFINEVSPTSRSLWYVDTGPLLERELAQRAGLGFIGKHTNLISRSLGNWIFLCEVITTLELPPDEPERNRCGTCERCISACPTGAITAPFQLDARRCISYLTIELKGSIPVEFRRAIGNRIYGCDDCLAVCPWNRFARAGSIMKAHRRSDLEQATLVELLSLDEAGFKQRFAGTPILRSKRRGFLRNVCVALGNVGDESALPALGRALNDQEPLIREHAQWAIEEIRHRVGAMAITAE